jgi:hypothetical protein
MPRRLGQKSRGNHERMRALVMCLVSQSTGYLHSRDWATLALRGVAYFSGRPSRVINSCKTVSYITLSRSINSRSCRLPDVV